jgi:hypothetical protein
MVGMNTGLISTEVSPFGGVAELRICFAELVVGRILVWQTYLSCLESNAIVDPGKGISKVNCKFIQIMC